MSRILLAPSRYIQGAGAIHEIGIHAKTMGNKAILIGGEKALSVCRNAVKASLEKENIERTFPNIVVRCFELFPKKFHLASLFLFLPFFSFINHFQKALNFRPWKCKYPGKFFIGVVFLQKPIDIYPILPASDNPSAGKHIILGTAIQKIDVATHPGASDYHIIILFDQPFFLHAKKAHSRS